MTLLNVLILSGHMTIEHDNEHRSFRQHNQWLTTLLEDTGRFRVRVIEDPRGLGAEIIDKYGSTAYGPMAALLLAKNNHANGDAAAAAARLQWAIDKAKDDETAALARLRLAGIRLDEKKYDEALALLEAKHAQAFAPLYADLRGDVLAAQGKTAEAREAYKLALEKSLPNSNYRNVLQIKLDALGPAK